MVSNANVISQSDSTQAVQSLRLLLALIAGSVLASIVLVSTAATDHQAGQRSYSLSWVAMADTDSVAIQLDSLARLRTELDSLLFGGGDLDSLSTAAQRLDSLISVLRESAPAVVDTLDTVLIRKYFPSFKRDARISSIFPRKGRPFYPKFGRYWSHRIDFDTTKRTYTSREYVGLNSIRDPVELDYQQYRDARLNRDLDDTWEEILAVRARSDARDRRGGLGFEFTVPGGRQSAFTSIFGKPSFDLRVNGQADILAGFDYRKSDQQVAITGRSSQLDPNFKQDLRLGITGTIGDKLKIDVQYDSKNQFDFENQISLQYSGYDDEIIQSIEAGNVFLPTTGTLIRGGQSLFGLKSEFQIGSVHLIAIASQQEGQTNSLNIEGGSTKNPFNLKPTDYTDMTGFFLSYYFRNRWEDAHDDPPNIIVDQRFERITEIEIWRLQPTRPEEINVRQVVAMIDLMESPDILGQANKYTQQELPAEDLDHYDHSFGGELDTELRDGDKSPGSYLETQKDLDPSDYQIGKFKRLDSGQDYQLDPILGYITLTSRLQESEALAVSYRYRANGRTVQVGDFSTETGGSDGGQSEDKLVLKLLRPVQLRQPAVDAANGGFNPAAWYMEMRNLYRLSGGGGIQPADFELQILYEPPGQTSTKTLPGINSAETILQLMNWDRVNADGALVPDDVFDYLVDYTIQPSTGRLIFPVLEPFGSHMESVIKRQDIPEVTKQQLLQLYVFDQLYSEKKANARKNSQHDVFRIQGSSKGTVKAYYDLQAFAGIVPGSVRVTSGGTPLRETTDFVVDYSGGTVTITNQSYLISGRQIQIDYEQNSLFNVRKKTLLGLRADFKPKDNVTFGATMMKMNEKSPSDKFRLGDEPISNTIWGADARFTFEPRWLTRGIDMIPFLQTKEPSSINFSGEFAQLRPKHVETQAFKRTENRLKDIDRSFSSDEKQGTSYIDDFEGFENTFSLMQPGSWNLASAPDSIGVIDRDGLRPGIEGDSLRTTWRSNFAWYRIVSSMLQEIPLVVYNGDPAPIQILEITDVFPTRDVQGQFGSTIETLDLYMNPHERGQYNYTGDLRTFLDQPQDTWGGMMHRLPEGFTDFSVKNIDFVEFVIQLFPENPERDAGKKAKLYVDLGRISEDVLPDEKLNNEDGQSMATISESGIGKWARLPNSTQNSVIDIDGPTLRTEDLGLDGLASYGGEYPSFATESTHFADFLSSLDLNSTDPRYMAEVAKALEDPSGDDYHYFGNQRFYSNTEFYPTPPFFQQHFSHYFTGYELNGFESQTKLAENTTVPRGNSRFPDTEDQNLNSTIDFENSYFQYELALDQASLDSLARPEETDDFVVGEITNENGVGNGWYQIRIPVQNFTRRVGSIQDFSQIETIRIWTSGHKVPITMRLASLELVGSQWQESERIFEESEGVGAIENESEKLTISSINNEENADVYIPPIGTVISETRLPTGAIQESREQSILIRKKGLLPGRQRGMFRTQNTALDLLKYSNLRMFVHMHGRTLDGKDLSTLPKDIGRSKASLFVRLGANENNDYYEYEQPLTPSSETSGNADDLWQTNVEFNGIVQDLNSMNIELGAFNQLKVARDGLAFPTDKVFYNIVNGIPTAPDAPDAEKFAPPGTRLGIKGNPSLGRITSIVIGIRNMADSTSTDFGDILAEITVWLNELRVSGYDATNGWAAVANADIKLADIGNIRASIRSQTDGFGSLASSLGEREQNNIDNWSVTTDLRADKLIPDRFNWSIPVSFQYQSNTSTPRFSPTRGDIRLEELIDQINNREDLNPDEKTVAEDRAIVAAQMHSTTRSFSARISKSRSSSGFMRNTIDGMALNYSGASTDARTPALEVNNSWRWNTSLSYRFTSRARTIKPLWLLQKIPLLGPLGRLQFNYLPQSLQTSGSLARNFATSRDRPVLNAADTSIVPLIVRFPKREKHTFTHKRNFGLQYNPFQFLNLSFDYNTGQSLNQVGVDTLISVAIGDTLFPGITIDEAIDAGLISEEDRDNAFEISNLIVKPASDVINETLFGQSSARTNVNDQKFTASFRPRFNNINALNWLQVQDISYSASFGWKNGALNRNAGASIQNSVILRAGATIRIQDFFRKFGFYRSIERRQNEYSSRKEVEKVTREREKAQRNKKTSSAGIRPVVKPEKKEEDGDKVAGAENASGKEASGKRQTPEQDDSGGGGLPLPSIRSWVRQIILAVTGIRNFTLSYDGSRSSALSNFGIPVLENGTLVDVETHYSIFDSFKGRGASPAYRFGFERQLGLDARVLDPSLQVSDVLADGNKFQARTTINPSSSLSINLNWNLDYRTSETFSYRPLFDSDGLVVGLDTTITQTGNNSATIWAFGASYLDMFESQLNTYKADLAAASEDFPDFLGDENRDGRVVLTNQSVAQDFQRAFVRAGSTLDAQNLLPFPRPNWGISYNGLSSWPLIRSLVRNITVRHNYSATYSADFFTNTQFGGVDSLKALPLGDQTILFAIEEFQVGAIRVNENYSPLIGFDIGWKQQFSTNIAWTKSNSFSLSTANFEVSRARTNEFSFTASWQKSGLRLPFLGGKTLANRVNFSLTISKSFNDDQRLRLRRGLEEAVSNPDFIVENALEGDNVSLITSFTRTTVIPKIGYQFSNKVNANFQLRYELFDSRDSRQPSSTVIQGNFNVRVSIAN